MITTLAAYLAIISAATVLAVPAAYLARDRRLLLVTALYALVMVALGAIPTLATAAAAGVLMLAYPPLLLLITIQAARRAHQRTAYEREYGPLDR